MKSRGIKRAVVSYGNTEQALWEKKFQIVYEVHSEL